MELDTKKETEKLQAEIAQLTGQLQQLSSQATQIQQAINNQVIAIAEKRGALNHIQNLDGEKPTK